MYEYVKLRQRILGRFSRGEDNGFFEEFLSLGKLRVELLFLICDRGHKMFVLVWAACRFI
jgi:hypothetical protein